MTSVDQRILFLLDLLIFQKKVLYKKEFCEIIGLQLSNLTKIKKGVTHFTVEHIHIICTRFEVNANWIFGIESKVFNTPESLENRDYLIKK